MSKIFSCVLNNYADGVIFPSPSLRIDTVTQLFFNWRNLIFCRYRRLTLSFVKINFGCVSRLRSSSTNQNIQNSVRGVKEQPIIVPKLRTTRCWHRTTHPCSSHVSRLVSSPITNQNIQNSVRGVKEQPINHPFSSVSHRMIMYNNPSSKIIQNNTSVDYKTEYDNKQTAKANQL